MARTITPISGEPAEAPERILAAQYVRMSTEHQQYSTQNQSKTIREYAERRGIEIIKTYSDDAKSGLIIGGRRALQQMISDVESGSAEYRVILVYDVTRWGRFQDADESAYYEYRCRKAGMQVAYCAEQFENDGSPTSTIVKSVNRRYRYYVSMDVIQKRPTAELRGPQRLPAAMVEEAVISEIRRLLRTPEIIARTARVLKKERPDLDEGTVTAALKQFDDLWKALIPAEQTRVVQLLVARVTVGEDKLDIDLRHDGLGALASLMTPAREDAA